MIYLDYNATAPYSSSVKSFLRDEAENLWANPSSEYEAGVQLDSIIQQDREIIADFLGCPSGRLFFTSGATESISTVLSESNLKSFGLNSVISNKMEHYATLDNLKILGMQGFTIHWLENNEHGELDLEHLKVLCTENPNSLVSLLYVNNETGVINDVHEIVQIAHEQNCLVHIDGVQALGKVRFSIEDIECDFISFSGHKIGALKGVGLLFADEPKKVFPLIRGGGQEYGLRAGTYNLLGIHSFKLAVGDIDFNILSELRMMRDRFEERLLGINSKFGVNAEKSKRAPNVSNVYLGGCDARAILYQLSREGIMVSTGSACSSGTPEPSHVIQALGFDTDYAKSSLRLSLGALSTWKELQTTLAVLRGQFK